MGLTLKRNILRDLLREIGDLLRLREKGGCLPPQLEPIHLGVVEVGRKKFGLGIVVEWDGYGSPWVWHAKQTAIKELEKEREVDEFLVVALTDYDDRFIICQRGKGKGCEAVVVSRLKLYEPHLSAFEECLLRAKQFFMTHFSSDIERQQFERAVLDKYLLGGEE
jgi:hypothetical protein